MRTEDLIRRLADDARPVTPAAFGQVAARSIVAGGAVSLALFALIYGPRPDLAAAARDPVVLAKTLLPLLLAALVLPRVLAAARPGGRVGRRMAAAVWLVPAAAGALFAYAFAVPPETGRLAAFIGHSIPYCMPSILLLSLPITGSLVNGLKAGAPARPWVCGALAGLAAGGLATTLYSLFCNEDSPLFYAVWYSGGIALAALAGAVLGRRLLRW